MGTVAERPRSRVFATAEDNIFINFGFEQDRIECGSHMRTVAERLLARTATRAPQIAPTGLYLVIEAFAVSDRWRGHRTHHPNKLAAIACRIYARPACHHCSPRRP